MIHPRRVINMGNHRINIQPGNETEGVTARSLLAWQWSKQTKIPCPLCDSFVEVPETLEPQIKAFIEKLGDDTANLILEFHHPPDMPKTKILSELSASEELEAGKRNRRDL